MAVAIETVVPLVYDEAMNTDHTKTDDGFTSWACQKCWDDAFEICYGTDESQVRAYARLIDERRDNPCTPEQQTG